MRTMLTVAILLLLCSNIGFSHTIKVELFLDASADEVPCASEDNYTFTFRDMNFGLDECTTHLFPQVTGGEAESWLQFSAKAEALEQGGIEFYLYFTRNDISGAITYCTEQNIDRLPYPLLILPEQNGVCQVMLPTFELGAHGSDDYDTDRSLQVRVSYDVASAASSFKRATESRLAGNAGARPNTSIIMVILVSTIVTSLLFG